MGAKDPRICGNPNASVKALCTEDEDFDAAAELADQVIEAFRRTCGSVGAATKYVARNYGLRPAWLQRLRERRRVPIYRYAYNNLIVALEDIVARQEAAIELERARIQALRGTHEARAADLPRDAERV
jgi:hypothetical protein